MEKKEFMDYKEDIVQKGLVKNKSTEEYSKLMLVLPVPKDKIIKFGSRKISPAHVGNLNNSVDFIVPEGTEVYAAEDGVVVGIKDDSKRGGDDPKYWNDGNYIEIQHGDEFTWYEHLRHKGVLVKVGDNVKQGQIIGYTGKTGFTDRPHIHFQVNRYFGKSIEDYLTLKAVFKDFVDVYKSE